MRVNKEAVHPMEFMYLVFTRNPGKSYRRRLRSLLLSLLGRGGGGGSGWTVVGGIGGGGDRETSDLQKPCSCCGIHENGNWFADTISLLLILS